MDGIVKAGTEDDIVGLATGELQSDLEHFLIRHPAAVIELQALEDRHRVRIVGVERAETDRVAFAKSQNQRAETELQGSGRDSQPEPNVVASPVPAGASTTVSLPSPR